MPKPTQSQLNYDDLPSLTGIVVNPLSRDAQYSIASALTQLLKPLGIQFKCSIQEHPQDPQPENSGEITPPLAFFKPLKYRLRVLCYTQKTIDYKLLAEPLARKLRSLNLEGFHDAVIQFDRSGSPVGESRLRLNLTPTVAILEHWARWGDVQSIAKLLDLALTIEEIQVRIALKDFALHIFCSLDKPRSLKTLLRLSDTFPIRKTALDIITPLLLKLAPQGIHSATIYGVKKHPTIDGEFEESPVWTHWLDLPAMIDPRYSPTPLVAAARGNKNALRFILERFLNPDLEQYLTVGGIAFSLLHRRGVLHIMSEAPSAPIQSQIAPPIIKILHQLELTNLRGVRIYGRISGQSTPQWSYGVDFDRPPLQLSAVAVKTQSVAIPVIKRLSITESLKASLLTTGIWKSQLHSTKAAGLSTISRFRWDPSILLLVAGLVLPIAIDRSLTFGLQNSLSGDKSASIQPTSSTSFNNSLLDLKIAEYQLLCDREGVPDVLIVGSSRALRGIDPDVLQRNLKKRRKVNLKIYNFGINGATARTVDLLLRQVLTPEQLPKLIIWADGARAFNNGRVDRTYENLISSSRYRQSIATADNSNNRSLLFQAQGIVKSSYEAIDTSINNKFIEFSPVYHHRDRFKTWLQKQLPVGSLFEPTASQLNGDPLDIHKDWKYNPDGFLPLDIKFDPATYYQQYSKVTGASDGDYGNFQLDGSQHQALQQVSNLLASNKISLVFVNLPLTDIYLDGFRRDRETIFKQYMQELASSNQLVFIDLDGLLNIQYSLFSDPSHLNQFGAKEVSIQLAKVPIRWGGK